MADFISTTGVVLLYLIGLFLLLCVVSSSFRRMIGEFFESCLSVVLFIGLCCAFPPLIIFFLLYFLIASVFDDDDEDDDF